jgi:hypothetical protein
LIHRIALGVLCTATASAAAIGISMHPQTASATTQMTATSLETARMNAQARANRSLARPPVLTPSKAAVKAAPPAPKKPLPLPRIAGLNAVQVRNAWAVVAEGHRMGVSLRGQTIAMATALQESNLINYTHAVDHDSLGIFQQRPSTGWGTPWQIEQPAYAAHAFYRVLLQYKGAWGCLTCAAQLVQRSAFPGAYAKHEYFAHLIVTILNKRF